MLERDVGSLLPPADAAAFVWAGGAEVGRLHVEDFTSKRKRSWFNVLPFRAQLLWCELYDLKDNKRGPEGGGISAYKLKGVLSL